MKNFVMHGDVVTVAAPSGGVASGDGVLIGALFGVATYTAAQGVEVEIRTTGVFDMAAATHATDQALVVGDIVYWDNSAKRATKTASGNTRIGVAVAAKASTAAIARVMLD